MHLIRKISGKTTRPTVRHPHVLQNVRVILFLPNSDMPFIREERIFILKTYDAQTYQVIQYEFTLAFPDMRVRH